MSTRVLSYTTDIGSNNITKISVVFILELLQLRDFFAKAFAYINIFSVLCNEVVYSINIAIWLIFTANNAKVVCIWNF